VSGTVRVQVIGGGKMGEALAAGVVASGWAGAADVRVVEVAEARREELAERFPGLAVATEPAAAEGTVIAVKPGDAPGAVAAVAAAGCRRIVSIAAGVTLAQLEAPAPAGVAVVRAMPNTPSLVGAGVAAIAGGTAATEEDLAWAEALLGAVGEVVRLPEHQLDAVTGLSGSGPAYVFLVAEALIEAGVLAGLPRDVATTLATSTLLGSARLLAETGDAPAELRAAVTSPGGTTAAGLRELERHGVRAALADAVMAAAQRSRELAG
jgi:pyrroline-5-carboxylate reductase